jgi:hypothetical protein
MAKQITFTFEGQEYTLEFTRKSVEAMERQGFRAAELLEKPMVMLPILFAGAFRAHHAFLNVKVISRIFDTITNKAELLSKLAEMYNEPLEAMLGDPEDDEGNVKWEASW